LAWAVRPKREARSSSNIANQGDIANQLNAQEAARTGGGGMGYTARNRWDPLISDTRRALEPVASDL